MARHLSIQLFAIFYALSLLLSGALAYQATARMTFAFPLTAEQVATLTERIHAIRAVGLGIAALVMLLVIFAGSRASRGALAVRWILGVATSMVFLRGAGLVSPLAENDATVVAASAFQLGVQALAILFLYGDDAEEWFGAAR